MIQGFIYTSLGTGAPENFGIFIFKLDIVCILEVSDALFCPKSTMSLTTFWV